MLTTQLGGKFSVEDDGIFKLKVYLKNAGIMVNYPTGDNIVTIQNGVPLTFDPKKEKISFYAVEIKYLASIKTSDVHIVYNSNKDIKGYIGQSASLEICYAIMHNKPIIFMYEPVFSEGVSEFASKLILKNLDEINILNILDLPESHTIDSLTKISKKAVHYNIDAIEEIEGYKAVEQMLHLYKDTNI